MAGIFGFFDYSKPGPGIPKDAPPKPRITVFFGIFTRKFWNLVKVNFMCTIFNLPAFVLGVLALMYIFGGVSPDVKDANLILSDLFYKIICTAYLLTIPVITIGPVQAGYTYILRNYAREEHAFIWGDFKDNLRSNFKQSSLVSIINFVIFVIMTFSLRFYFTVYAGTIANIGAGITLIAFILFLMMNLYIYPMMVTFDLTLKQLYKNSFLFAYMKFFPNLGILLLCAIIILFTFGQFIGFHPAIGILLYFFITSSTIGLITNFYVYPRIKKYMITEDDEEESEEDSDFKD